MKNFARSLVLMVAVVMTTTVWAAATATPSAVVARLNDTLLRVMRDADKLGFEGRRKILAPVLTTVFDLPLIARASVGRYWRHLDEGQRKRLTEALARRTIATYANRFDGYSGERFQVVSEEAAPRNTVLVKSELIKGDGEVVRFNYLLRQNDQGWHILDVYLKGVYSQLAVRRSQYTSILERQGFDRLIAAIDAKTREYETAQGS